MPRQFRNARLMKHLKVADAMKLLGLSQPTLSAWEGGRKSPSIGSFRIASSSARSVVIISCSSLEALMTTGTLLLLGYTRKV